MKKRAIRGRGTTLPRGLIKHGYEPRTKWDDPPSRGQKWEDQGTVYKISLKSETIQFFLIKISPGSFQKHNKFLGGSRPVFGLDLPLPWFFGVNVLRWNLDLHRKALDKGDRDGSLRTWSENFSADEKMAANGVFFVMIDRWGGGQCNEKRSDTENPKDLMYIVDIENYFQGTIIYPTYGGGHI